ncbi:Type 1 glutamine amidotransferase-like domain-containing protein [Iodobacter ciconiae]|uniref:Peptidase S51 n=1 Tax=Iodobacter ciconiae TaxID=2496266 RepID=A0A3S8ZWH7_9NEIS|nr:Type 1 glutamine amidotransferase-like domain-containing protein [Iodobacter ciconiae]AZN37832.1 peptidase S51 [Iodobacter ciconiae]
MKNLFLSSSFPDVTDLFLQFTNHDCKGKTVTFIPTASIPETITFYVNSGKKALEKCGLIVDELEISSATIEEISKKLIGNDYIYITGGNAFFLLQELKRTGADKILTKQILAGKLYIGESAGSIILSPDIEYVSDMDDAGAAPELKSFSSLAAVDIYPLPHHTNFPFKEIVSTIIKNYNEKIDLYPISNTQAIAIKGCKIQILGK